MDYKVFQNSINLRVDRFQFVTREATDMGLSLKGGQGENIHHRASIMARQI